ncbi:hypothetical protein PAXRUDRAFT_29316, partial [Paxillus rubicundulus Ve08.2h10]
MSSLSASAKISKVKATKTPKRNSATLEALTLPPVGKKQRMVEEAQENNEMEVYVEESTSPSQVIHHRVFPVKIIKLLNDPHERNGVAIAWSLDPHNSLGGTQVALIEK